MTEHHSRAGRPGDYPANAGSIAFHRAMGCSVTGPVAGYHGPGRDLVRFERAL